MERIRRGIIKGGLPKEGGNDGFDRDPEKA